MRPLEALHDALDTAPRWVAGLTALLLAVGVGLLDRVTGSEISASVFYVVPIGLAAWYAGPRWGLTASLAAAVLWYVADLTAGHMYTAAWIPVWNAGVRLAIFAIIADLIRRLHASMATQTRLAETDAVTGLYNARRFLEAVEVEARRSTRYRRPLSLAYMDLDGFKTVNDAQGHHTGDIVLEAVGAVLRAHVRATDVPCRVGGDEFAVLYPETDAVQVREAVAKMQMALEAAMARRDWPVTVSIGVLTATGDIPPAQEIVRLADDLMYQVKKGGKASAMFAVTGGDGRVSRV